MSSSGFFGLKDGKVALWNSATSWGTEYDVLGIKMFSINEELVNGRHEGDDIITALHAKTVAAVVELEFLFATLAPVAMITGRTVQSCGDDEYVVIGKDNMPYFGVSGLVDAAEGADEALEIFLPKLKIDSQGFSWSASYGGFLVPRIRCLAVYNDANYGIGIPIIRGSRPESAHVPPIWA